jgi:hypothetical protein
VLFASGVFRSTAAQQQTGRALVFPVAIQWSKQKAVKEYRLQIAADEKFQNVFFDKRIAGERYLASELPPGHYYWRVAPAEPRLGNFSRPTKFFISGGVVTSVKLANRTRR